jgi:hypothetical protein
VGKEPVSSPLYFDYAQHIAKERELKHLYKLAFTEVFSLTIFNYQTVLALFLGFNK